MRTSLLAAVLVGAGLAFPAPATHAADAASSCDGRPVTLEASAGVVAGTEGPDVVLATDAVVEVDGLGGDDLICLRETTGAVGVRVDAGAGDDRLLLEVEDHDPGSTIDMGPGRDTLQLSTPGNLRVHLDHGGFKWHGESSRLRGVEDVVATGHLVKLFGDEHDNSLTATGCYVRIRGYAGDDRLAQVPAADGTDGVDCEGGHATLRGESGDDVLRGYRFDDRLLGGGGHDRADGDGGTDRCLAEHTVRCES